jgi:Fe2+ or Zn2+ uptake regulation protein
VSTEDYVISLLRSNKLKVTPQRIAILKVLINGGHFSIDQLLSEVRRLEPSISMSTVYVTLNTLAKAGIVRTFEVMGKTWYEISKKPHINVLCEDTGDIVDINDIDLTWIENKLRDKGIDVKDLVIIVRGNCRKDPTNPNSK